MDVTGWTVEQKMRLPDWCFGHTLLLSCRAYLPTADSWGWWITTQALPDPACIWAVGMLVWESDYRGNYIRMGLSDTLPTSEAEMNGAQNIFPDLGDNNFTPPIVNVPVFAGQFFHIPLKKGLATGGKKFVLEGRVHSTGTYLLAIVYIVVTKLPTSMAGWLAHNK